MATAWADHAGLLTLPSGAAVRGRRIGSEVVAADFALLLSGGPHPDWTHRRVRWPDFWRPLDQDDALDAIHDAHRRAITGKRVEVACRGGVGRTGTALAALVVLEGLSPVEAIAWVRQRYHPRAVETPVQRRWLNTVP